MTLNRDLTTPDNRDYWAFVDETADEVKLWPAWMKGGAVVSRKQAEEVLERVKDELKDEQISQLKADLKDAQACNTCGGDGKSTSSMPCACGGTGLVLHELLYMRKRCFELEAALTEVWDARGEADVKAIVDERIKRGFTGLQSSCAAIRRLKRSKP